MSNLEEEYIRDKKYIHDTLDNNKKQTEKLHDSFEEFKVSVTSSIAVIQTKVGLYVAIGTLVFGIIVNVGMTFLKG